KSIPLMGISPNIGDVSGMSRETKAIAERLVLVREAVGLNQASFARLVGIEPQAINNYERGLRRISVDQALKICAATGASLDYIYRGLASSSLPVNMLTAIQERLRQQRPRRD